MNVTPLVHNPQPWGLGNVIARAVGRLRGLCRRLVRAKTLAYDVPASVLRMGQAFHDAARAMEGGTVTSRLEGLGLLLRALDESDRARLGLLANGHLSEGEAFQWQAQIERARASIREAAQGMAEGWA